MFGCVCDLIVIFWKINVYRNLQILSEGTNLFKETVSNSCLNISFSLRDSTIRATRRLDHSVTRPLDYSMTRSLRWFGHSMTRSLGRHGHLIFCSSTSSTTQAIWHSTVQPLSQLKYSVNSNTQQLNHPTKKNIILTYKSKFISWI